jgi:hypothetical protein
MVQYDSQQRGQSVSGWAIGGVTFAATMMFMIGIFQAITGLVAIINDNFYLEAHNYAFNVDVRTWGWIHLVLGLVLVATGWALASRTTWAGITAVVVAVLSAIANFFFIPYYPIWSVVIIGLDVWVIWSLTRPGAIRT